MSERKVSPTDFAAEIERLEAAGKLPTLEQVLDAVADARHKFAPQNSEGSPKSKRKLNVAGSDYDGEWHPARF